MTGQDIQMWIFDSCFPKTNELYQWKERNLTVLVVKFKISRELENWKPCVHPFKPDNFLIFKDSSNSIVVDIYKGDF